MQMEKGNGTMRMSIVIAAVFAAASSVANAENVTLTINTPGGAIQDGGKAVLWGPAGEKLGVAVKEETADNSLDVLRLESGSGTVKTDIIIMSGYQAAIAGAEGLLEPLDYSVIDGSTFIEGSAAPYCIGIYGVAATMAWNTKTYAAGAPSSWMDFWDTEKFPGTRAMRADAEAQIEMALLADGVPADELYKVMSTDEGLKRAMDKIASLKPNISIWWTSGAQHSQLMKDGEVDMSTGWNARFQAAKDAGGPAEYTFNQGILSVDCFAVTKGSAHKAEAMKLVAEMSKGEPQAKLTKYISYGPMNLDAYKTGLISPEVEAVLPTSPANGANLVVMDNEWWAKNNDKAQQMFEDMMTE